MNYTTDDIYDGMVVRDIFDNTDQNVIYKRDDKWRIKWRASYGDEDRAIQIQSIVINLNNGRFIPLKQTTGHLHETND